MTTEEIIAKLRMMARYPRVTLPGDTEALKRAAELLQEQFDLPEPRLTGKFSITVGQFKCTGCTGTWTNRDDAKHHSCKDFQ